MESGSTHLWISSESGADELRSLLDWLRHEEEFRGRVRLQQASPRSDEMGGVLEALVVALGSGGTGAVLARSLSTWLSHRRSDVKLTIKNDNGRTIELDAKRVDAQALVGEVGRLLDPPE